MNTKAELRKDLAARRLEAAGKIDAAGERLAEVFLDYGPQIPDKSIMAGYWPIRSEIDVRPLMERLRAAGVGLALPAAQDRLGGLVFRRYEGGTPPAKDAWGIPAPAATAPIVRPHVVLVPLLGFDTGGGRLGYGAGIYDGALNRLRASGPVVAIGVGFGCQQVKKVPHEAHDALLDWVITDQGVRVRP